MTRMGLRNRLGHSGAAVIAGAVLALASIVLASGCARSRGAAANADESLTFAGSVVAESVAVPAPALPVPAVPIGVGLGEGGLATAAAAPETRVTGLGARVQIATVTVEVGDRVERGEVIAIADDALLRAFVASARTDVRFADARVRALQEQRDEVRETQAELANAEAQAARAIGQLSATRSRLVAQLADARSALARVQALRRQRATAPPPSVTPTAPPPGARPPGASQLPDPSELRAAIGRLQSAIVQIDSALARARAGSARAEAGRVRAASARASLTDAIELARLSARAARVSRDTATAQLALARVEAPVDGVVLSALPSGGVVAPGATVVELRPDSPARVRTWLSASELPAVTLGQAVAVRADWAPGERVRGRVTRIGEELGFPPTSFATSVIHLTRAVPVEATLESSAQLPPGTPADMTFEER